MFGFGSGKSAYPSIYAATNVKKSSKKDNPSSAAKNETTSSPDFLEPAIDGPPSPERIRAYTEQMKRSSIFGNNSRTNTISSATSSSRSRESTAPSTDNLSLSRRSSNRSNTSSMPSIRSERPESIAIFGSIFSRAGRKVRRDTDATGLNRSSSSLAISTLGESASEEGSTRERYYGKGRSPRRKQLISGPYNFQHVTHTRQDHLPNLERASRMQLVSEFSAIRDSQSPTHGELKGIRAEDLHFENFSSEALDDSVTPPQPQRMINYAKSHDNLRSAPPRPPRSPLSHACPVAPPARTSSRTASILFDTFDPLATTTIERPYTSSGFRRPAPFSLPSPPPPPSSWKEHQECNSTRPLSHAVTTPGDEAWPLTALLPGNSELADVKEEDEDVGSRKSRVSVASSELRMSQSVPALRRLSYEQASDMLENRMSTTLGRSSSGETVVPRKTPLSPGFQVVHDSWEDDIDYCYEHEVEADCDYQWDRCSVEERGVADEAPQVEPQQQPILELHLQDEERVYHGHFRPSLLTPTPFDLPELSPMSNASSSVSSHPQTPSNFLRPNHVRSPSHASSFKESHGFHLSPTLLIPADFQLQMEQDEIYHEQYNTLPGSASIFVQDSYQHSISPVDEGTSSTASYRSSNFSRGSARSSSSTRMSGANSRGSQDSVMLLGRTGNLSEEHRSVGSASSLPDLVPSTAHQSVIDFSATVAELRISDENIDSAPAPQVAGPAPALASLQHRRNKSLVLDGLRKGVNHFPPVASQASPDEISNPNGSLSPVAESFPVSPSAGKGQGSVHGRKASAPTMSSLKEFKGRARAATAAAKLPGGKKRGSYMLFPQV
ncbi:hypothetical protein N431DRAFT_326496 [Stipitochalara longipes BDJ]|nr:hypothetical protein N431DRAFT_326496 [Stipitochalara longipes BDJ]